MNYIIFFIVSITMLLLTGCTAAHLEVEENPFNDQAPLNLVPDDQVLEQAKKSHGIVNVHRHGPGLDVLVTLNAGDSDMVFTMDLPHGGEMFYPEIKNRLAKSKAIETKEEIAEISQDESKVFNNKSLNLFSEATKHMLSAQALFYRKAYWKALEETNLAMSLIPKSAQAYALKGSIYYKMGRKKDAKAAWIQALRLDPTLKDVKRSLERVN